MSTRPDGADRSALAAAHSYLARGWAPIPVRARSKQPFNPADPSGRGWQTLRPCAGDIDRWFARSSLNIGVLLGAPSSGLVDIDLDDDLAIRLADEMLPPTDAEFGRLSRPRSHRLYLCPNAATKRLQHPRDGRTLVELRSSGCQTVFPPSTHPSGEPVAWASPGDPSGVDAATLSRAVERLAAATILAAACPAQGGRHDAQLTLCAFLVRAGWPEDEIARFVAAIVGAAGGERDPGKRMATARDAARRLRSGEPLRGYPSLSALVGDTVAPKLAAWLEGAERIVSTRAIRSGPIMAPDAPTAPENSEEALALAFAERHAGALRYVAAWDQWRTWQGTHWSVDATLDVVHRVREHVRAGALASGLSPRQAATLASLKTVTAVERLARADRRLAATAAQWDADPWALATPEGQVDLTSGEIRTADPLAYISRCTRVAPAPPDAAHPTWSAFLERVTDRDADLQAFLRRIIGYGLTGSTGEHALFFLYGPGRNGKGVFLNTIAWLLDDYARVASMETFTEQRHAQHPTDLAMLRGARFVTAQETEAGRRWAEARIKSLTGGDPISARFMRQDFFTFTPTFKLFIAGNHPPSLRGVDEAIRARLLLIPFSVTIPEAERDPNLGEALRAEAPAILRWAIAGCGEWRACGLDPPEAVRAATAAYFAEEDAVGRWLDEACAREPRAVAGSSALFQAWTAWAQRNDEIVGTQKAFSRSLIARGLKAQRLSGGRNGFSGLRLLASTASRGAGAGGE